MSSSKNILLYIATYPLSLLSRWLPKNKYVWLFGSWNGTQYNDNSKYLFKYVNINYPEIRAIWLTRSKDTLDKVKQDGYECYLMYSFCGILVTLRAYIAVISRAKAEDLPIYISPYSTKIVQLWHGTPLKKLGRDKTGSSNNSRTILLSFKSIIRRVLFPQSNNNYSIFLASSVEVGELLDSAYGHWMKRDAIKVTGYPRNDELYGKLVRSDSIKGIYLPTFRDWDRQGGKLFNDYGFNAKKLSAEFRKLDVTLDMKLHPETVLPEDIMNDLDQSGNISFVGYTDIYEHLGKYDFIITDYSSIYFDYLILDRPVIFAPFDLDKYKSGRGMYFDYHEVTPGIKAYSWPEVLDAIAVLVESGDDFKEQRKIVNTRINLFVDNNNCNRVVTEIKQL